MSTLLDVKDLRTGFHTHGGVIRAVDGVDFSIAEERDARWHAPRVGFRCALSLQDAQALITTIRSRSKR